MAAEKAPAYQWYVKDWRSSRKVQRMSFKERGMYREMLDEQWERVTLPGDPASMAALLGGSEREWKTSWPVLIANFSVLEDGRLQNDRLELVRKEMKRFARWAKKRAAKGGLRRAETAVRSGDGTFRRRPASHQPVSSQLPASLQLLAPASHQPPPAIASSTSTATATATAQEKRPPPDARSRRPIFSGQRLTVFEWMLDELLKMLEPHGEAFGLDEWFWELDKRCLDRGEIPPERDNGAWLKAVTLTEAQRRGLPLRVASRPSRPEPSAEGVREILRKQGALQ